MSEKVLITGYNGALAKRVAIILEKKFHLVFLTSNKESVNNKNIFFWNINEGYIDPAALIDCKHIVHLCGFNIMNRWTKKNRELMYSSRVLTANLLFNKCCALDLKIKSFIGASAMGYYGLNTIADVNESSENGDDWLAKLSLDWENAANQFVEIGSRVTNLRISLLMDLNSGFLKVTLLPLKIGIASVFTPANLATLGFILMMWQGLFYFHLKINILMVLIIWLFQKDKVKESLLKKLKVVYFHLLLLFQYLFS